MKDITVQPNITIRQAMKKLSQSGEKCLVIVDEKNTLLGTLSDGDLRKAILNGSEMNDSIQNIYQVKPTVLVKGKYELDEVKTLFKKERFDLIPVVDEQGVLIDILFFGNLIYSDEDLTIPHSLCHEREFVLTPMIEIAPEFIHPVLQEKISEIGIKVIGY